MSGRLETVSLPRAAGAAGLTARRSEPLERAAPVLLAAALAIVYLAVAPYSADLAAHVYRADLLDRAGGLAVWNNGWYGGHHALGYSVLFPPLAWLLGVRLAGALAVVAAAALFAALARDRWGADAHTGSLWFAAGSATLLLSGRLPFALGIALGLGALLAHARGRARLALGLAVACALASPVAALFLALAGASLAATGERRGPGLALAAAALLPIAALVALFPEGGDEPFVLSAFLPVPALAAFALWVLPREERALRAGAVLYAVGCAAAFLIDTPVGGNAARLGALAGGPLLACALWRHRRAALALALVPLAFWQWTAAVRDVSGSAGDPSVQAAFYAPLIGFLERQGGPPARVEVPFTRHHWESARLAPTFPLARGWERQLDRRNNALFYEPGLTAARYRAWLGALGVRWVALPDAALDPSARAEARLLRAGVPGLRPAWRGRHWRVWEVTGFAGLARGPADLVRLGVQDFELRARAPGTVRVAVRETRWWTVTGGDACVTSTPGGWTRVRVRRPGTITVAARLSPARAMGRSGGCRT